MLTNNLLIIALLIQVILLAGGLMFLFLVRRVIIPHSVWLAFILNDLLWLLLIADQISHLSSYNLISAEWTVVISFVITLLFLFRVVMRYRAHRQRLLLNALLFEREQQLERLRREDEDRHGHKWELITRMGFDMRPSVYHVDTDARHE